MMDKRILYNRWINTLDANKSRTAVIDIHTGKRLTFSALQALVRRKSTVKKAVIGDCSGVEFIVQVLWAWRDSVPFLPTEKGSVLSMDLVKDIPDDVAHIKHTSGTTGDPRMVLFMEEQLEADADQIVESMQLNHYDWNIGVISTAHSYGFSNLILPLLLYGIPLMLCNSPLPETLKQAFSELSGQAILPAVPAMWSAWHKTGVLMDCPVGLAISAGAPLSAELVEDVFISTGIKIHNFYGTSECGGIAYNSGDSLGDASNVIGKPIAGVELEISDNGRLIVKSCAAARGYWPVEDTGELGNGRFLTSDLGEIDKVNGEVTLIGRISEMINVAGRKLSPLEVEKAVLEIEGIRSCVAFGVPSRSVDRVGDVVACFSALGGISDKYVMSSLQRKLPSWKMPRLLWHCNELKVNNLGKIPRAHWREKYMKEHLISCRQA